MFKMPGLYCEPIEVAALAAAIETLVKAVVVPTIKLPLESSVKLVAGAVPEKLYPVPLVPPVSEMPTPRASPAEVKFAIVVLLSITVAALLVAALKYRPLPLRPALVVNPTKDASEYKNPVFGVAPPFVNVITSPAVAFVALSVVNAPASGVVVPMMTLFI